jgi:AcrR family transcriptional regulator
MDTLSIDCSARYPRDVAAPASKRTAGRTPRDAVRGEVFAAVLRLLERGDKYTSLRVGQICDEAGVARSAFYVNFADKTDLLLAFTELTAVEIARVSEAWLASEPMLGLEALIAAEQEAIGVFRQHAALLSAYAEVAAYDEQVAAYWRRLLDELIDALALRIEEGQASGEVRAGLAPRTCARFIVLGSEWLLREHVATDRGPGDQRMAQEIAHAIWAMLHA